MDRKEYWNKEYAEYWRKVTEEAEDKSGGQDSKIKKLSGHDYKSPDVKVFTEFFDKLKYEKQDVLLDYGCGLGRFFPYFSGKCNYYGIDISQAMIDECMARFPDNKSHFIVAEGEKLPFSDGYFDKIICNGVFDACFQEQALKEMIRVCKIGGCILISGKNNDYFTDDEEALVAEENARKKGHPNYFTDLRKMLKQLRGYANVIEQRYALRRGDFGKSLFEKDIPNLFYEWELIIQKNNDFDLEFESFSDAFSDTWKKKNLNH